ncbi:MAG: hypothetical protein J6T10_19930 [Methanobrevibacter sp.]|nr:hypothetical protein [Methanobrevibacter sp.]
MKLYRTHWINYTLLIQTIKEIQNTTKTIRKIEYWMAQTLEAPLMDIQLV